MLPLHDNVPTRSFPVVTVSLIAVNALVWFWELGATNRQVDHYAWFPCAVQGPCQGIATEHQPVWETLFSSMFMHASWIHILGNMLFLWIFGNNVEDAMGHVRFLVFYLLAGIAATALQTVVTLHTSTAGGESIPNLGASGAIAGVLGAYLVLLPWARVLTLVGIFPVQIPAVFFLGIWFLLQFFQGNAALSHPEANGGVAVFAHIGGMIFGFLAVRAFTVRKPLRPSY